MVTQQIIRMQGIVAEGGQIVLDVPALPPGTTVELLVLVRRRQEPAGPPAAGPPPPAPRIRTAADVELFLEAERAAWEH